MRFLAGVLLAATLSGRVIVVSLDGMGHQALMSDPAAVEMRALRALGERGVRAGGVIPHFPSTTANSHAALFTGAWGDVNGIVSNSIPLLPRSAHTAFERVSGYRSDGLRAEPLWVAAGRQGVKTVALQVPQAYPFTTLNTGDHPRTPPVVVNGYQTKLIAPHLFLRMSDVRPEACAGGANGKCFQWAAGPMTLRGRITRDHAIEISTGRGAKPVTARMAPLETEPPRTRDLARHFSPGLMLKHVPESSAAMVYFRLFELSADGSDFLLYQSPIHELGIHHGAEPGREVAPALIRDAGGFVGNGPERGLLAPYALGKPLSQGGDGTAERRYLEACELVARQAIRHAAWFMKRYSPELFLGYLPYPDETEHRWKGAEAVNPKYAELRAWGYAIVNRAVEAYTAAASPGDNLIFVSDHGMAPVRRHVALNAVLGGAGLLATDEKGAIDPLRTKAVHLRNCIILNTADWKGGIVPVSERGVVLQRVKQALASLKDPDTGQALVSRTYDSIEDAARFGFGGPNGADLCFDYVPGYAGIDAAAPPLVRTLAVPAGVHGFDPTRPAMHAILVGAGPGLPKAASWPVIRGIDIAPLVADLLKIDPPRHARGTSPLRRP